MNKVIVIMPAYNAEKTLKKTFDDIPKELINEVILVDDNSQDKTVKISKSLGITTIQHKKNMGYGGNQKTCFTTALNKGGDIIIMIHPDYQYDPKKIPFFLKAFKEGADIIYGSRMLEKGTAQKGGMPLYKRVGNFFLTKYMNFMLKTAFTDAATGYIAYRRKVLETIPFLKNSNGFTFDEEVIIQCAYYNFKMKEVPIPTIYNDEASSISFTKSLKYGFSLFIKIIRYKLHKFGILKYYLVE